MLGKIENGQLVLAQGKVLRHDNVIVANPREEDWVAAGYKEVVDGKPLKEKEGFYQVPEYTEEDDKIKTTYRYEEITDDDL
jgi:hypothetical protein